MKALDFTASTGTHFEVHVLNPGEVFPGFGGSRTGLLVKKTPSIIVRERNGMGTTDHEYSVDHPEFWKWIQHLLIEGLAVPTGNVRRECGNTYIWNKNKPGDEDYGGTFDGLNNVSSDADPGL